MKCTIALSTFLIWARVLLTPVSCQTCRIDTKKLQGLWYLNRSPGYDLNVLPAWRKCINGTGVTVGVVDRGVQDHYDLDIDRTMDGGHRRQGYQSQDRGRRLWYESHRYRYGGYYQRWMSRRQEDNLKHGTRVAGIIAAKYNDKGVTGVAFGARIADIRIASSRVFETLNARLLNHRYNDIDVYSCSFANFHTGTKSFPLLPEQENALKSGTSLGRRGLGSVYVFSTGNSGGEEKENIFSDSCAYDRLVTNRYVISVAGIQHDLQKLPSGEECAAMLISAFTASPGSEYTVKTTDIRNGTTTHFNQNSAAVPMVSGAVALALSANDRLEYRDIMHLLVKTARSNNLGFSFITNAAGLKVSSVFGFGLLDVGSLVESSRTWQNVPPMQQCAKTAVFNTRIERHNNNFMIHVSSCAVTYIEHVEVKLIFRHPKAGQIKWVLMSPYGTRSTILPGRRLDQTVNMDLTVLTVQMWGENPNGNWKLEPSPQYDVQSLDQGTMKSATITIYGTTCGILQCLPPAQQEVVNRSPWSEWSQCSVTCGQGQQTRHKQCGRNNICVDQSTDRKPCFRDACPIVNQAELFGTDAFCPFPNQQTAVCTVECLSTSDCSGDNICCANGCGHTCVLPVSFNAGRTRQPHEQPTNRQGWSSWSSWSPCTTTCGLGTKSRKRFCLNRNCLGGPFETASCNNQDCCTDKYGYCQVWIRFYPNERCPSEQCRRTCGLC